MLEIAFATLGALYAFARIVSVIRSFMFVEERLRALANRPVNDREAILTDHVMSSHRDKIKYCTQQACAGLI